MQRLRSRIVLPLAAAAALSCAPGAAADATAASAAAASASAAGAAALPRNLPVRRDVATGPDAAGLRSSLLLLALTGAAGAGAFWWRKSRASHGARVRARSGHALVARLASQPLTPHASVHAIAWNGEEYLVGCTPQQVTLLARRRLDVAAGEAS